nr:hypothetical protein [Tanacetum cinerariifolium]
SEGSDADDFSELKKITALLAKAFNQNSETSSSLADDMISEVSYYLSESESESEYETLNYYDNTTTYGLFVNDNDDHEIFRDLKIFLKILLNHKLIIMSQLLIKMILKELIS